MLGFDAVGRDHNTPELKGHRDQQIRDRLNSDASVCYRIGQFTSDLLSELDTGFGLYRRSVLEQSRRARAGCLRQNSTAERSSALTICPGVSSTM